MNYSTIIYYIYSNHVMYINYMIYILQLGIIGRLPHPPQPIRYHHGTFKSPLFLVWLAPLSLYSALHSAYLNTPPKPILTFYQYPSLTPSRYSWELNMHMGEDDCQKHTNGRGVWQKRSPMETYWVAVRSVRFTRIRKELYRSRAVWE